MSGVYIPSEGIEKNIIHWQAKSNKGPHKNDIVG